MSMRSTRVVSVLALTAVTAVAASGCGSSNSASTSATTAGGSAKATSGKQANIAYLSYADTDFVQGEEVGVKAVAAKSGGSVTLFNANFDPQKQLQQCSDAITSGRYNAILLGAVDAATGVPCVKQAAAAKIPVATIENAVGPNPNAITPQVDGVVAVMVNSGYTNADAQVQMVKSACQGIDPCKVIVEVATPTDRFTNQAMNAVKKMGGNVKVVQTLSGQYDPSVIAKAMPDALSAHPDANVFASASDSQALAVVPVVKQAGMLGKLKLLGNGGSRQGAQAVANGTLLETIANWPIQAAKVVTTGLVQAVNGQKVTQPANDALKISSPLILNKGNVSGFTPEWGAK